MTKLKQQTDFSFFEQSDLSNVSLLAGVDEAGRGPLAGAVVAAAVILPSVPLDSIGLEKLNDSKKLTEKQRNALFEPIKEHAVAWAVAWADHKEIDHINILQATMLAMHRSLLGLQLTPNKVIVDGNRCPKKPEDWNSVVIESLVKGDSLVPAISAASVLAKVTRDRQLQALHENYPMYGFNQHKGYPTKTHLAMLQEHGPCPEHRFSFAPVRNSVL